MIDNWKIGSDSFEITPEDDGLLSCEITCPISSSSSSSASCNIPVISNISPASGPKTGNTVITITGTNLNGSTIITIGGNNALINSINADGTIINASTPAGNIGSSDLLLSTSCGNTSLQNKTFLYEETLPVITNLEPKIDLDIAGGNKIIVTGSNLLGITDVYISDGTDGDYPVVSVNIINDSRIEIIDDAQISSGIKDVVFTNSKGSVVYSSIIYIHKQPIIDTVNPNTGSTAGGTLVHIQGQHFTNVSSVEINNISATIIFNDSDDKNIYATTPASGSSGSKEIKVTSPGGIATLFNGFTYTNDTVPTITSLNVSCGPLSGGTVVTITGTNLVNTNSILLGSLNAQITSVSSTTVVFVTPANTLNGFKSLVLTTSTGKSLTSINVFNYVSSPIIYSLTPTTGRTSGGGYFTIRGVNLETTNSVTVGGTQTSFWAFSVYPSGEHGLECAIPAMSVGSKTVVVTTCSGSIGAGTITYYVQPSISSDIVPNNGPTSGGTIITITGSGFDNINRVMIGNVPATEIVINSDKTSLTARVPAGSPGYKNVNIYTNDNHSATKVYGFYYNGTTSSSSSTSSGCPNKILAWGRRECPVSDNSCVNGGSWLYESPENDYIKVVGTRDFSFGLSYKSGLISRWGVGDDMDYGVMGKDIPSDLGECKDFDIGRFNGIAVLKNGSVRVWGDNTYNQISVPTTVGLCEKVATGSTWGGGHLLAIKENGTIVAWGRNDYMQCEIPYFGWPYEVPYIQVEASAYGSIALRNNGTVVIWGLQPNYSVGFESYPDPIAWQPGVESYYTKIAAGSLHYLGLLFNGAVKAWGVNTSGQCNVPPLPTGLTYTQIAGGFLHSVALRSDGAVIAWGHNGYKACGDQYSDGTHGFYCQNGIEYTYNNVIRDSVKDSSGKIKYWKQLPSNGKYNIIGAGERHTIAGYTPFCCGVGCSSSSSTSSISSSSLSSSSSAIVLCDSRLNAASKASKTITSNIVPCSGNRKNALVSLNSIFYVPATPDSNFPDARKIVTAGYGPNPNGKGEIYCPLNKFRITLSGCSCTRQPEFSIVRIVSGVETVIPISETGYFYVTDYDLGNLYLRTKDLDTPGFVSNITSNSGKYVNETILPNGSGTTTGTQTEIDNEYVISARNAMHNNTGPWLQEFYTKAQGERPQVENVRANTLNNAPGYTTGTRPNNASVSPKLGRRLPLLSCLGNDVDYNDCGYSSYSSTVPMWTATFDYYDKSNKYTGAGGKGTVGNGTTVGTWVEITNTSIEDIGNLEGRIETAEAYFVNTSSSTGTTSNLLPNGGLVSLFHSDELNGLRLDYINLPLDIISNEDYISFEKYFSHDYINPIKKILASDMLPLKINGNHIFGNNSFNSFIEFNFQNINLNCYNIYISSPFLELNHQTNLSNKRDISSGIKIECNNDETVKFHYIGYNDSWISSGNLGVSGKSFVNTSNPEFTIGLLPEQTNPSIKIQTDLNDLNKFFKLQIHSQTNSAVFGFNGDYGSTGGNVPVYEYEKDTDGTLILDTDGEPILVLDTDGEPILLYYSEEQYINKPIFEARINSTDNSSEFVIFEKLYIGNLFDSIQFSNKPKLNGMQNYIEGIIPFSNSDGILDNTWVNRYVTKLYDSNIKVGDIVRLYGSNNLSLINSNFTRLTKANANTETNSNYIGIVEKISNNKCYVVTSGQFNLVNYTGSTIIYPGETYYLSNSNNDGNTLTKTKPTTIIKNVVVGVGFDEGILLNSNIGQNPIFNNISVTNSLINEQFVFTPDRVNDTLSFRGGAGITLTHTTDDAILISASGGAGTQNTFSQINGESATGINDNIQITGLNGLQVQVSGTQGIDTEVELSIPNSFGIVQIVANSTDDEEFTINSTNSNDTLEIFAGTGISITANTNNGFVITATGTSVPGVDSVTNSILAQMPAYAIKASDSSGNPIDVQFQSIPAFSIDGSYNFYINNAIVPGPGPGGDGVPSAIAGYVIGRITDETGTTSSIKSLNRSDLRMLLGIANTGWIQPLEPTFKYIEISSDNTDGTTLIQANTTDDILSFVAGDGIIISSLDGSTDNQNQIKISVDLANYIAPLVKGFDKVKLDNSSYYTSLTSNSILEFNETPTISPSFGTTDNATISFSVKSNSITNNHLAKMDAYTVKANNDSTDENPSDVSLPLNTVLGRLSGDIVGLSSTNLKSLLGLTSSNYFKQISITNTTTETIVSTSILETIKFVAGTNVTLTKDNNNNIIIGAGAAISGGIKTIQTTNESSGKIASKIFLDTIKSSNTFSPDLYTNISIYPSFDSLGVYTAKFDLSPMPNNSVKVSSRVQSGTGFIPSNLVLENNTVLGSILDEFNVSRIKALTQLDLRSIIGIKSASIINLKNNLDGDISLLQPISFAKENQILTFMGINGITLGNVNGTITISGFNQNNVSLYSDAKPKLFSSLDLNNKSIKNFDYNVLEFSSYISGSSPIFGFKLTTNDVSKISVVRNRGLLIKSDLELESYGLGSFVTIKQNYLKNDSGIFIIKSNTGIYDFSYSGKSRFYIQNALDIESTSGQINYIFGTNNSNLRFAKNLDQIQIYTDSVTPNDIVFAAGWNNTNPSNVSVKSIIFKSNIILDNNSSIISSTGNVQFRNGISIIDSSSSNNMNIITKKVSFNLTTTNNIIDSNVFVLSKVYLYDLYINDSSNIYSSMFVRVKVVMFGNQDIKIITETPQYSAIANNNTDLLKSLTFSSSFVSNTFNLLLNTIDSQKQYTVKFTRLSF